MALISYEDLRAKAVEMLKDNDDLFVEMVNEVDGYNGFADGFRAFPMYEIDELHCGVSIGEFLDRLTSDFNHNDDYFYYSDYGLESTDNIAELYRDNVYENDLLEQLIKYYPHIFFSDSELEEIVEALDLNGEFYDEDTLEPVDEDEDEE
jgi:hypothetical protein